MESAVISTHPPTHPSQSSQNPLSILAVNKSKYRLIITALLENRLIKSQYENFRSKKILRNEYKGREVRWNSVKRETVASHMGKLISYTVLCVTRCSSWERPCFMPNAVSSHLPSFVSILALALDGSLERLIDWLIDHRGSISWTPGAPCRRGNSDRWQHSETKHLVQDTLKTNLTNPSHEANFRLDLEDLHFRISSFSSFFFIPSPFLQHPAASENGEFPNQSINQSIDHSINPPINPGGVQDASC